MSRTVHLVDDDTSFLRATARMLRASGYEVAVHDSAREFLENLDCETSGCVVTDLAMPGYDGRALQNALAKLGCGLPVVFLSGQATIPDSVAAVKQGAEDFLTKQAPREDLLRAINAALEQDQRRRDEADDQHSRRTRLKNLSPRELDVLSFVIKGWPNKQIAGELGIHERTVKLHRTAIYRKTGLASSAELATLCAELGNFSKDAPTFPKGQ